MAVEPKAWWVLLGSAVVSVTVGYGSFQWLKGQQAHYDSLQANLEELQAELSRRREGIELVERLRSAFLAGEDRGWWRPQERFTWVAASQAIARETGVAVMRYRLHPGREERFDRGVTVWAVDVDLDLGLAHEERLLALWRGIGATVPGLFSLESCELKRTDQIQQGVHLQAQCHLVWYAVVKRDGNAVDVDWPGGVPDTTGSGEEFRSDP